MSSSPSLHTATILTLPPPSHLSSSIGSRHLPFIHISLLLLYLVHVADRLWPRNANMSAVAEASLFGVEQSARRSSKGLHWVFVRAMPCHAMQYRVVLIIVDRRRLALWAQWFVARWSVRLITHIDGPILTNVRKVLHVCAGEKGSVCVREKERKRACVCVLTSYLMSSRPNGALKCCNVLEWVRARDRAWCIEIIHILLLSFLILALTSQITWKRQ